MPYGRLVDELTEYELELYAKFYAVEPWGFAVQQAWMAQLQAAIYNAGGNLKRSVSAQDFMPSENDDVPLTPDSLKAMLHGD